MAEVTMPRLSDTMSEGTVRRWLKQPGDQVAVGEIIAEIETDKALMELEAFESGVLQTVLVPEGETVPIGEPIALIGAGTGAAAESGAPASGAQQAPAEEGAPASLARTTVEARAQVQQPAPAPPSEPRQPVPAAERGDGRVVEERVIASPVARLMAEEHGIDLRRVQGTGPGGRIIRRNVEDFLESMRRVPTAGPAPAPLAAPAPPAPRTPAGEVAPLSRMRRAVARAMTESKPGVPHIYVAAEIDMAAALKLRREINEGEAADIKISVNDLVVKAAAAALRKFPALNSSYATGADGQPGVVHHEEINVSVAVALEDGLIAPVVKDTDKKSLSTIAAEIRDMAGRAREGRIKQTEIEGATFQVSNLGMFDVLAFVSVITPPQAGSLAVGTVRRVPVVREDGQLGVGELMLVILSADHRVTDGATAARYLQEFKRLLQSPMRLLV